MREEVEEVEVMCGDLESSLLARQGLKLLDSPNNLTESLEASNQKKGNKIEHQVKGEQTKNQQGELTL